MSHQQGLVKSLLGGICLAALSASVVAGEDVGTGAAAQLPASTASGAASSPVLPETVKPDRKSEAGTATILAASQRPAGEQGQPSVKHRAAARVHWWYSRVYCRHLGCNGVHMIGTAY